MEIGKVSQGGQVNVSLQDNSGVKNVQDNSAVKDANLGTSSNNNNTTTVKEEDVKKAVDKLNKFLEDNNTFAEYEFHDKFKNDLMIKIVDKNTNKVIQEFPPKKILDMVAKMCELVGVLFDKKA